MRYFRCSRKCKFWTPFPSHYNLSPHFFLWTWSVKWSNIVCKMISPKIKLLRGDTNTLKFANINRVYFRVGQPKYISLTQKNNNKFRIGLALHEPNVDDISSFWWRKLWSQFSRQKAMVCWAVTKTYHEKTYFHLFCSLSSFD